MADTINTNSFFNQPEGEGGGISSVQALAQNAFDISTTVRTQFRDFVQTFDKYKLDAGEGDRLINNSVSNLDIEIDEINKILKELQKNYESFEDDIRGQDKKITNIDKKVDEVSEVFFKFEQSHKAAAEKAADDAFRAQDAAQKAGDKKEDGGAAAAGLGGLGGMFGGGDKGSGGGGDEEKKKPPNFWKNPWMWGLMGAGALHGMGAGISGGIKRGVGGYADFMTGGLFDFAKRSGGGGLRIIGSGLKNMFGGKKKEDSTRIVSNRKVKPHYFDMKSGKAYIDGEEVPLELYEEFKSMSDDEKLNDPRFSTGDPIIPTEETDEKGLEPKGGKGKKKE